MKKKILIIMSVVMLLLLSGCSNLNDYLTDKLEEIIREESGIYEDPSYYKYQNLQQTNQLNEDGVYLGADEIGDEPVEVEEPTGKIHVTFAENSHIRVTYYRDADLTEEIHTRCYFNPGDSIYASDPEIVGAYSDKYVFSGFKILKFDSDGQYSSLNSWEDDDLVIEIPVDYEGSELSVLPLGKYEQRKLELDDCYIDADGNEAEFYGTWQIDIDSKGYSERTNDTTRTISAIEDYTVSYDYSDYVKDYYFVESDPEPFKTDDTGIITFSKVTAQNGCDYYHVILHRFINVRVNNEDYSVFNPNIVKLLSAAGEEQDNLKKKELMLKGLKCGDVIMIRVDSNYKVTVNGLDIAAPVDLEDGSAQEYIITVPETSALDLGINITVKH